MKIESLSNNLIKHAASLKQKKYRDQHGQFLAEGLRLVLDACALMPNLMHAIFLTPRCAAQVLEFLQKTSQIKAENLITGNAENMVLDRLSGMGIPPEKIYFVSEQIIKKLSQAQTPQQIIAIINKRECNIKNDYIVFLDKIRDPGNLGTIFRTAAAAGYSLVLNNCADPYSAKAVQGSMSAVLSVDFIESNESYLFKLSQNGYTIYAADLQGENLFKAHKSKRVCVIIGNEANGVGTQALAQADKTVTIPMKSTESLNAAISAALAMYYFKEV